VLRPVSVVPRVVRAPGVAAAQGVAVPTVPTLLVVAVLTVVAAVLGGSAVVLGAAAVPLAVSVPAGRRPARRRRRRAPVSPRGWPGRSPHQTGPRSQRPRRRSPSVSARAREAAFEHARPPGSDRPPGPEGGPGAPVARPSLLRPGRPRRPARQPAGATPPPAPGPRLDTLPCRSRSLCPRRWGPARHGAGDRADVASVDTVCGCPPILWCPRR
jgi:hypothetical protein